MMVQLFLSEPLCNDNGVSDVAKKRLSLLKKLESIIWTSIASSSRSEARLWLCNTISCMNPITPNQHCNVFVKLLSSKQPKRALAVQLLQMIFEKRPQKAAQILTKKSYMVEKFFKGNPRRILLWFDNFSHSGKFGHRRGSRALSQFAFVNRDICWEELEWKGKHGQAPAMVATKPHYFLDLDIQRTVENFLENVPEFWSSDELAESLKDGEILHIDTSFFVDYFVDLMYKEDSAEVWQLINEYLKEESFSVLCHHLLIVLEEQDLCAFLGLIGEMLSPRMDSKEFGHPSYWLEIILSTCNGCFPIEDLLLLNAVINQGRLLIRLIEDEEDQKGKIKDLVFQICATSTFTNLWASLIKEFLKMEKVEVLKWLGLQSWALHHRLLEECKNPESWEALFMENGIVFRKSDGHPLLSPEGFFEESGSDLECGGSVRVRRKKKATARQKKRRRDYSLDADNDNELVDFDSMGGWQGLQSRTGNWFLSTDGYSSSWNSADLPEHLAKHCFSTWMKWISCQSNSVA
ncbi:uncharacterized protein LOC122091499 [Macadamia integrifolia]|uniref:uncharacterized protein LOC122091499 n=1 Tax=Macadamia integrifolia TaxID=60698 RepID=UPI001C4FF2B7|nr:uncharacterized protein LOC122091499 [Macadamia integrifolia]XP_042517420.1 uncharacterized protein LOC122091499 [Macadamia integrifolia]